MAPVAPLECRVTYGKGRLVYSGVLSPVYGSGELFHVRHHRDSLMARAGGGGWTGIVQQSTWRHFSALRRIG